MSYRYDTPRAQRWYANNALRQAESIRRFKVQLAAGQACRFSCATKAELGKVHRLTYAEAQTGIAYQYVPKYRAWLVYNRARPAGALDCMVMVRAADCDWNVVAIANGGAS